jgi:hypothetical protein
MGRRKMTETTSAKIYQFPAGGRSNAAGRRTVVWPSADYLPAERAAVNFGSGWYHEEAIREDELKRAKVRSFPTRQ